MTRSMIYSTIIILLWLAFFVGIDIRFTTIKDSLTTGSGYDIIELKENK